MHFFNATHTSINVVPTTPSTSLTRSSSATVPGAPFTPLAPMTPTRRRLDVLGDLPRSTGRARPGLRNFCKHATPEALRRSSREQSRSVSQSSSGKKRGRDHETSETCSTTPGSDRPCAVAPAVALDGSEVRATSSTSGATHAESPAANASSAEMTHASTYGHLVLHKEFAQASHPDPRTPQWLEIDIQLSCPALYKVQ